MEIKIPIQLPDNWEDKVVEKLLARGDFVEVVRCKDCENYELMKSNNAHFCNKFGGYDRLKVCPFALETVKYQEHCLI